MVALIRLGGTRLFLAGQAVSLLGDGLAILAIPLLVLELTHNPAAAALASVPRAVGYLVAGLPAGPLIDRANPWHVLIAADIVRVAIFATLFGLSVSGSDSVGVILALAFISGVAGVFFETALAVAVRDLCRDRELVRANSFLESASQSSILLGPMAVGLLAVSVGLGAALLVNAGTFVVSLATLWGASRRATRISDPPGWAPWRQFGTEFRNGLRYLATTSILVSLAVLAVVANLCLGAATLVVFFARDYLSAAPWLVGLVVAGGGLGGVLGAATAPALIARFHPVPLCVAATLVTGVALASVGLAPTVWWLAASNLVLVWSDVLASIVVRTLRQQIVPRELLGRVTSAVRWVVLATTPLGAVLAGLLTQLAENDPRPAFLIAAALLGVSTPAIWAVGLRRHRNTPLLPVRHRPSPRASSDRSTTSLVERRSL
ncbi:MFS transporter [Nocardia sp. NBC_01009]|uniref:MFS transporter n=1 Tax=Nocardia sp. NBC_01009 TaxID=2975996 RepID=UPI00386F5AC2|nr:MFS transporter [Nocardia sp. NBC_01009]